jgi:hypothetical protein
VNSRALLGAALSLMLLMACSLQAPQRTMPTSPPIAPTGTPVPIPTAAPIPTTAADYFPTTQLPAAYVHAAERDRTLSQPTLSGLLRSYTRPDAPGREGLVQVGVTLADTPETATLVFASTMNGWVQQGYLFAPLAQLGELAVVGRRTPAATATPDSIIVYFRRGTVDGVVLWSDADRPPLEDNVVRIAHEMDVRAQANPQPALP